jgi:hypothetical protein
VHQDHAALQRVDDLFVRVVAGRRGPIDGHFEPEHAGVERLRSVDVGDGHAEMVDRSDR